MKITHNKIGRNLNLVDGGKSEKSSKSDKAKGPQSNNSINMEEDSLKTSDPMRTESARVDLSSRAMDAKKIKAIALEAPDVNHERVAELQKLIDSGKYKIDAKAIADKMVDEHLNTPSE